MMSDIPALDILILKLKFNMCKSLWKNFRIMLKNEEKYRKDTLI